ncbi:MAG: hypothetical protein IKN55_11730, partial [Oscillospiraceae bacterium]|nr:hypothetical protein [Oscillospiraceae bacterium]
MKTKRLLAAAAAAACFLTAAGCSQEEFEQIVDEIIVAVPATEPVTESAELTPESAEIYVEDPSAVYASTAYRPEMFYGKYAMDGTNGMWIDQVERVNFC